MSTLENSFDAMNFKFNGKYAIGIDILSGERWIHYDELIKGCKKNYDFFGYVCKQMSTVLEKHIKADGEGAQEIVEEMKKSASSLSSFNDKLAQFILDCKNSSRKDKDYVLASGILYLLNKAKDSAFAMLSDASCICNGTLLRNSSHNSYLCSIQEYVASDAYLEKYKCINAELDEVNSMSKKELNSIVKLADDATKTTVVA